MSPEDRQVLRHLGVILNAHAQALRELATQVKLATQALEDFAVQQLREHK